MPIIFRKEGFRFIIRTHDHLPPHVHVLKSEGHIKIAIGSYEERPYIMNIISIVTRDAKRALEREIHG